MKKKKTPLSKKKLKQIEAKVQEFLGDGFHDNALPRNKLKAGDIVVMTPKYIKWEITNLFNMNQVDGKIQAEAYEALTVFLGNQAGYKMKGTVTGYGLVDTDTLDRKCVQVTWKSDLGSYFGYFGEPDLRKVRK